MTALAHAKTIPIEAELARRGGRFLSRDQAQRLAAEAS
jgi:hypothetical protein